MRPEGDATRAYFDTPARAERLQLLLHLVRNAGEVIYLRAPAGAGKTLFAHRLLDILGNDMASVWIRGGIDNDVASVAVAQLGLADGESLAWPDGILAGIGGQDLLIVVDDADQLALPAVERLAAMHARGGRLLLLGHGGLAQTTGDWDVQYVDLPPLTVEQSTAFLRSNAGDDAVHINDDLAGFLHHSAHGRPGLLLDALDEVVARARRQAEARRRRGSGVRWWTWLLGGGVAAVLAAVLFNQQRINAWLAPSPGDGADALTAPPAETAAARATPPTASVAAPPETAAPLPRTADPVPADGATGDMPAAQPPRPSVASGLRDTPMPEIALPELSRLPAAGAPSAADDGLPESPPTGAGEPPDDGIAQDPAADGPASAAAPSEAAPPGDDAGDDTGDAEMRDALAAARQGAATTAAAAVPPTVADAAASSGAPPAAPRAGVPVQPQVVATPPLATAATSAADVARRAAAVSAAASTEQAPSAPPAVTATRPDDAAAPVVSSALAPAPRSSPAPAPAAATGPAPVEERSAGAPASATSGPSRRPGDAAPRVAGPAPVEDRTATAAAAPSPVVDDAVAGGLAWVRARAPGRYTLQLVGARDRAAVEAFVRVHRVAPPYAIFERQLNGRPWFSLVAGDYPSRDAAVAARGRLPKALARSDIWPRTFASVQEIID